jgi:hypothetical protein
MKKLKHNARVIVYHEVSYFFYDGKRRVDLDWGQVGHIPNGGDRFPHPERDIDLRLDDILWADDC